MSGLAPEELGLHRLAIPTPFLVGRVNCWLIEDEPLTLVDTGPNSGKALDTLEQALAARGHRIEDLGRVIVSHQHIDHEGLVSIVARRSGAEVCALAALAGPMGEFSTWMEAEDRFAEALMLRHGIAPETTLALRAVSRAYRGFGAAFTVTRPLAVGDVLEFGSGRRLEVLHRPGHSPSDTCLHDAEHGILLAADHLLAHVSSNALISLPLEDPEPSERPQALVTYLESMAVTRAMELALVLPGHGENVTDHRTLIDARVAMHEKRAAKILELLTERGALTAHQLAEALWGRLSVSQAYLTLSEVLGHVDLLAARGQVAEIDRGEGVTELAAL